MHCAVGGGFVYVGSGDGKLYRSGMGRATHR
jgi:hypothetical protein